MSKPQCKHGSQWPHLMFDYGRTRTLLTGRCSPTTGPQMLTTPKVKTVAGKWVDGTKHAAEAAEEEAG